MAFYLYRVNGGEVIGMSIESYGSLPAQFAELENPTETDGPGLSPPKIRIASEIRNATAGEITAFAAAELADETAATITLHKTHLDDASFRAPLVRALAELVLDEVNLLRAWTKAFKVEVAAATTLADLKTRVATLSTQDPRTKANVIAGIKTKMDGLT